MTDADERKWIHPLLKAAVNVSVDDRVKEVRDWYAAGAPYLTPRAKAVLKAVEEEIQDYAECSDDIKTEFDRRTKRGISQPWYKLARIRRAYKENL